MDGISFPAASLKVACHALRVLRSGCHVLTLTSQITAEQTENKKSKLRGRDIPPLILVAIAIMK